MKVHLNQELKVNSNKEFGEEDVEDKVDFKRSTKSIKNEK